MVKALLKKVLPQSFWVDRALRLWYADQARKIPSVHEAIQTIDQRWQLSTAEVADSPIFIFSAEWRAGSTLLQRLVNSDRRVLIWGEPFHKGNFVQCLSDSLRSFTPNFPPEDNFINSKNFVGSEDHLFRRWTANLYPEMEALVAAQRAFFQTLYQQPARDRGFERWGIKEVRLTMDHAYYLKWLFPQAKFIFLYRNPYKAYQSCHTWRNLYLRWPEEPVVSPEVFGQAWNDMVSGFQAGYTAVDGLLIKYEDFCQGDPSVSVLSDYLQLDLDADAMKRRIGSQAKKVPLSPNQMQRLKKVVDPLATSLGYDGL
jgi:hypothetical protein